MLRGIQTPNHMKCSFTGSIFFIRVTKSKSNEVVQYAAQTNQLHQQNEPRLIYCGRLRDWSCFLYLPFH